MREEKNHPGKAFKCNGNAAAHQLSSQWMPHHGRSLETARSLENIARHPQPLSTNSGAFNNQFKRYSSLRIVRKLSRLLSSSRASDPCYAVEHNQTEYPDLLHQPVDVHLPKRSTSDDGSRRVLSRRHILTSLREEEEESFRSMNQQLQTSQTSHFNTQDHNIRETKSLERFIPQVNIIYNDENDCYGERSNFFIPRSKPRTIFTRGGSSDLEGGSSEAAPPFSRFSMSLNRVTSRLDPVHGDPCLRLADEQTSYQQEEQQDQCRRRTKSISCSPDWSSYSSGVSGGSRGLLSERSESNLSSLSVCSSSGEGKRFSRCLLLQSISKEEIRDPLDSDCSSSGFEDQEPMSPDRPLTPGSPMSPGSPCSRQSADDLSSRTSTEDEAGTSDEEVDNKNTASITSTKTNSDVNDNNTNVVTKNCDNKPVKSSYTNQTNDNQQTQQEADGCQAAEEVGDLQLSQLHWIGTLGIGGFGRVELVTAGLNNNQTFALKKMKKIEIQEDKHQQHILNEKNIMMSCSSPFIVKLYRTFRDSRYLYMLMEPCLGGELWSILRDKKKFDDSAAKFYTACVIKGFEYLHSKGIVYRDLKPENLLLDASGYVKLTDFGFSKQVQDGEKSWTFCGTPEYVAPEMITNKTGHDKRADIWSVGILMYELLNGIPPFAKVRNNGSCGDKPKNNVYSEILQGMKGVYFPPHMTSSSVELIRQLCRLNPAQRPSLAITRKYMWFASMDWQALEERRLSPPFLPKITGSQDTSNFDNYTKELEQPKEDFSDWDIEF